MSVEVLVRLHLKTGDARGALKVSRDGDESTAGWLPKACCTFKELGNGMARIRMDRAQAVLLFGEPLPLATNGKAA
jgi:hypothetical protein